MGDLGATYYDHLRLIRKRVVVVDVLLVLTELFSLGITAEALSEYRFKIGNFAPTGLVNPKFQVKGVARHQVSNVSLHKLSFSRVCIWIIHSTTVACCHMILV